MIRQPRSDALLAALAVLGAVACDNQLGVEEHRAYAVVQKYNLALPGVYAGRRPALLADLTTDAEMDRVAMIVGALAQDGKLLDARQESADVRSVTLVDAENAQVVTTERWWYRHIDERSRAEKQDARRVVYQLRYHVRKQDGVWRLDRVEVLHDETNPAT